MVQHDADGLWDDESRKRFMDDYSGDLLKVARREVDGSNAQTPQDAANELIDIAVETLAESGCVLPEPIRVLTRTEKYPGNEVSAR